MAGGREERERVRERDEVENTLLHKDKDNNRPERVRCWW